MAKKGYCDVSCWMAKGTVCKCWCTGMNHGVGNEVDGILADLLNDPILRQYGFTEEDFEFFTKMRSSELEKKAALNSIAARIMKDYNI